MIGGQFEAAASTASCSYTAAVDHDRDTVICNFKLLLWLMGHRAKRSSSCNRLVSNQKSIGGGVPGAICLGGILRERSRALEDLLSGVIWALWCSWIRIRTLWPQLGIMGVSEP